MKTRTRLLLVFLFLFVSGFSVKGQVANFIADYTSGCAPLVVHFTNTSSGATSYSWNLGNSTVASSTDASTSYLAAGTYTVTLTASNGSSANTHTLVITVYPVPAVSFSADQLSVCPGAPVTFTSTSTAGVAGPMTYMWNFGDGGSSTATTPTHAFAAGGDYNITLAATNAQGCQSSLTKTAYIHVFTPAVPSFTASATYLCKAPATVTFTNLSTGTGTLAYQWSFGDGSTSGAGSPTHTYTSPGTYTVKLIVTDGNGCKDSLVHPAYIYVGNIAAGFTGPASACLGASVVFTNTSSTTTGSTWYYGDGGSSMSILGVHTYTTAGTYNVQLVVSNGPCHDTIYHPITITPGPAASFTMSPTNSCPAPAMITFTGTLPAGATAAWKFGDGGSASGSSTTHTYANNGIDTVWMIVTSSIGCKDTIRQVLTLYNIRIDINHDTISAGCVPLTVNFNCHVWTTVPDSTSYHPYPFGIASYTWTYGDGTPPVSGPVSVVHTYTAAGIYYCKVRIVTANGCVDSARLEVMVGTPPVAAFTAAPTHICAGKSVIFTNTSTGATNYFWIFGDGSHSIGTNPSEEFSVPGTFTVTLIAYNNGCPDTFQGPIPIIVDSPSAFIGDVYACNPRNEIHFFDYSLGDNNHLWIFGDGATSTLNNPTHDYPSLGTYTVTLTTFNTASGCRDTALLPIDLRRPVMNFYADDTTICLDGWATFTPVITGDTAAAYFWYRNGVLRDNDTGKIYTDTFHATGLYTIMLVIRDSHLCLDTFTKTNYITVAKPVANFSVAPASGCWPLMVTFTDHSTDAPGVWLTNFEWTFGDGATGISGTTITSHTYTVTGIFDVQEIVTDNIGCKDTLLIPALINVYKPHASFNISNVHPCAYDSVFFTNTSTGMVSSLWVFGDGTTSTAVSPAHVYTTSGSFPVKLIVYDTHGCTDTISYAGWIVITQPHAAFTMSDTFSICAPLSVTFTNLTTGATSCNWIFGDGNFSTTFSPSDLYITSGYYNVTLVATDVYGCKDTVIHPLNLYGYAGAFTYDPDTGCAPLTVNFHADITNVPSIIWDFGDGSTSSASSTKDTVHTYTIPGGYVPKLILSDNSGCQNSSRGVDTIKVDAVVTGFTTMPEPVCQSGTFHFVDTSRSYWSIVNNWLWSFDGGTSSVSSPSYIYSAPGTYTVSLVATDAWGCTATASGTVIVYPPPIIHASPDTTICVGDAATLVGYGGVSYTWAAGTTLSCTACENTFAAPVTQTTYTVTGVDTNGCQASDTVTVSLRTTTTSTSWGDTAVCFGTSVQIHCEGATNFTWIPATGLSSSTIANPYANPAVTTTYTVVARLGGCTESVNYVTVTIYPIPTIDAGPDQTLLAGSTAQLQATGRNIATLLWTPSTTLSCDTCYDPVASMSVTTTYTAEVASEHGCKNADSVTIHLYCSTSQLFIPNTFTPNGDGQNDVFYPRGTGVSSVKSFRIYNRWGELLFERDNIQLNDESNAWDGSFGSATPRADVYVYVIDAICETGEPLFVKGDVTIVR